MNEEEDQSSAVWGGTGTTGETDLIRRRPEPLWIVALVIALPIIALAVIYVVRHVLLGQ